MRLKYKRTLQLIGLISFLCCFTVILRESDQESPDFGGENQVVDSFGLDQRQTLVGRRSLDEYVDTKAAHDDGRRGRDTLDDDDPGDQYVELKDSGIKLRLKPTRAVNPNTLPTQIEDMFISVKTTKKYHQGRLDLLLDTWVSLARDQTYFFTDTNDEYYHKKTNGHLINTNCSQGHNRQDLCCKMSVEYDYFIRSSKRWFCHVDDDTYLNVPRLVQVLQDYNHTKAWYIGKPSLAHPIEMNDKDRPNQKISFWFATGGAGFCISRALALQMMPHTAGGKLMDICDNIRLPDDCSIGYIINHLLKKDLTIIRDFHSHLEGLGLLSKKNIHQHITLSYAPYGNKMNVINVAGFDQTKDPTRFRSIHCKLHPYTQGCPTGVR
ncbi:fringe glycosyltransferase-like [Lineus longissimus]|uniref:fringe glycosyltransferase-like n=1 Tax=Lineus longissimus TaxID=88925 RepID=UPI00315D301B